ncbi:hypothetical protein R3P38DRAFT_1723920 [Favolaschia claudopus]|uniref:Uncharacterized protein n=1 Tax=Favolaschia claudopus TaxID=2862362 RepID=A0AAW0ABN5_9AGAR
MSYPFSPHDTGTREMVGRSEYPASTFSSWGNHGDLDERVVSPTMVSADAYPSWETTAHGTIESRYQAAFTPGHASSSSIDRNDPSPHQRFRSRAPIPKGMTDTRHVVPSETPVNLIDERIASANQVSSTNALNDTQPSAMMVPAARAVRDAMTGRQPPVSGYPPPYTSQ